MTITLLDFTAAWCGPCRILEPVLDQLAADYGSRLQIEKIDVEVQRELAERYGVRSMPTVVLVREGREVGRTVGVRPRAFLAGMIDRALAGDRQIASP